MIAHPPFFVHCAPLPPPPPPPSSFNPKQQQKLDFSWFVCILCVGQGLPGMVLTSKTSDIFLSDGWKSLDTSEIMHIDPIVIRDDAPFKKASDRSKMARFNEWMKKELIVNSEPKTQSYLQYAVQSCVSHIMTSIICFFGVFLHDKACVLKFSFI